MRPGQLIVVPHMLNEAVLIFLQVFVQLFIHYIKRIGSVVITFDHEKASELKIKARPRNKRVKWAVEEPHLAVATQQPRVQVQIPPKPQLLISESIKPSRKQPQQTRMVTTTFESTLGFDRLLEDVQQELEMWTQDSSLVCAEVMWVGPVAKRSRLIEQHIRRSIMSQITADKYSLSQRIGLKSVPISVAEETVEPLAGGLFQGVHRQFATAFLDHLHQATGELHHSTWPFTSTKTDWSTLLDEHRRQSCVDRLCMVNVNLMLLKY